MLKKYNPKKTGTSTKWQTYQLFTIKKSLLYFKSTFFHGLNWKFNWKTAFFDLSRIFSTSGIRMLDQPYMTDLIEANSMGHEPHKIDIYSASWGPTDDGKTVDGPRNATMRAIVRGVNEVLLIFQTIPRKIPDTNNNINRMNRIMPESAYPFYCFEIIRSVLYTSMIMMTKRSIIMSLLW